MFLYHCCMQKKTPRETATPARSDFVQAASDAGAVWLGLFALGLALGVLVTGHGLPWWLAPLLSGTVYAGSVEFLLVGMLAATAPISVIAVTTFLVNSRHVFYGLSFPLHRVRRWRKAYSVYTLSDEAYALITTHPPDMLSSGFILWTQAGLHLSWVAGATVGALAGATVLNHLAGLDFILTALFVALAMDAYHRQPDNMTVVASLAVAVAAVVLANDAMLLVAMTGFSIVSITRHALRRKHARTRGTPP